MKRRRQRYSNLARCAISGHAPPRPTSGARLPRREPRMAEAFICDYIRTPIGRFAGSLSSVRADDLGAVPLKALMERNSGIDWEAIDDLVYGCVNQAGED